MQQILNDQDEWGCDTLQDIQQAAVDCCIPLLTDPEREARVAEEAERDARVADELERDCGPAPWDDKNWKP